MIQIHYIKIRYQTNLYNLIWQEASAVVIWCDVFAQSHSNNENKNIIYVIMTNFTLKSTIDAYLKVLFIKFRRKNSYK